MACASLCFYVLQDEPIKLRLFFPVALAMAGFILEGAGLGLVELLVRGCNKLCIWARLKSERSAQESGPPLKTIAWRPPSRASLKHYDLLFRRCSNSDFILCATCVRRQCEILFNAYVALHRTIFNTERLNLLSPFLFVRYTLSGYIFYTRYARDIRVILLQCSVSARLVSYLGCPRSKPLAFP